MGEIEKGEEVIRSDHESYPHPPEWNIAHVPTLTLRKKFHTVPSATLS